MAMVVLDTLLGSVRIPLREIPGILAGNSGHTNLYTILMHIRLPRVVTAILTGAGLSVAGLIMQTLFRNPLAGPYVLGISSGASLGVALFIMSAGIITLPAHVVMLSYWGQAVSAISGALLVFLLIVLVASRVRDSVSLLIVGIMFGSMTTALVSVLQYFSEPDQVQKFVIWTMGSLSATGWEHVLVLAPLVLAGVIIVLTLIKPMNALLLGENNARTSGVPVLRTRYLILISTSIIAGSLTAFTGPIAFIGLAVPHLTRMLFRTTNHRTTVPASLLCGALLLITCDLISQVPGQTLVLPVNAITALFGAPVVLWIILGRKRLKSAF